MNNKNLGRPKMAEIDKRRNFFNIRFAVEEKLLISENIKQYSTLAGNTFSLSEYIRSVMTSIPIGKIAPLISKDLRGARKETECFYLNQQEWDTFNALCIDYCSNFEKVSKNEFIIKLALTKLK